MTRHLRFWRRTLPAFVLLFSLVVQGAGLAIHRVSHLPHSTLAAGEPCDHAEPHRTDGGLADVSTARLQSGDIGTSVGPVHRHDSSDAHAGDLCFVCAGLESSALLLATRTVTPSAERSSNVRPAAGSSLPTLIRFRLALARAPPPAG